MLAPSELQGREVESDALQRVVQKCCFAGLTARNNSLNSWFVAQIRLEGFCFKCSLIVLLFFTNLKFQFPELQSNLYLLQIP